MPTKVAFARNCLLELHAGNRRPITEVLVTDREVPLRMNAVRSKLLDRRRKGGCATRMATMREILRNLWLQDDGQDVAEYAVMLAVVLVIVVGTVRLIGSNANNVFSSVGSSIVP
jgi:Flp pilus assembly pilin Flp